MGKERKNHLYLWPLSDVSPPSSKWYQWFLSGMIIQVHISPYPPGILGGLCWAHVLTACPGLLNKSTEGGQPTASSRLVNSLLAFMKVPMMERCGTGGVSKWTVSHSLCVITAMSNLSLYIDAPLRQTEAPFNKLSLWLNDCVSRALKFEQDPVWFLALMQHALKWISQAQWRSLVRTLNQKPGNIGPLQTRA